MSEQLSLLDWRPPAEIIPFPLYRSHGATAAVAKAIVNLETAKRTGKLNSLRAQTRKRMEPLFGSMRADIIADDLIRMIRIQMAYRVQVSSPLPKQIEIGTVISFVQAQRAASDPHGDGVGIAGTLGRGTKFLVGLGEAHEQAEYDAARAHDGGAA